MPGEKDIRIFIELFSQIYYLAEQGDRKVIETVCSDCENINWFYNWIIYSVKMAELCAHTEQMNSKIICESVITNLELLLHFCLSYKLSLEKAGLWKVCCVLL